MVLSSQKLYILYQNVIFKEYQHSSFKHRALRKCQNWSIILYNIVTVLLSTCMSFNKMIALWFLSHTVAFFPRFFLFFEGSDRFAIATGSQSHAA